MRAAVVGHVEWVEFVRVDRMPRTGEIVHALEWWSEAAGGGPGAAVQLAKLAGGATLFTALGDDDVGRRARKALEAHGLEVHAATRSEASRRALTHVDADGERTITVLGERHAPRGDDDLPWDDLDGVDALYFTAGDEAALAHARRARVVVATARVLPLLARAGVALDALVGSANDPAEAHAPGDVDPPPRLSVWTDGDRGGRYLLADGTGGTYDRVAPPGPVVDRYGAGDSFAGGLAYGLAATGDARSALALAARCGAAAVTGRGPYEGQLRLPAG